MIRFKTNQLLISRFCEDSDSTYSIVNGVSSYSRLWLIKNRSACFKLSKSITFTWTKLILCTSSHLCHKNAWAAIGVNYLETHNEVETCLRVL